MFIGGAPRCKVHCVSFEEYNREPVLDQRLERWKAMPVVDAGSIYKFEGNRWNESIERVILDIGTNWQV